MTAVGTLPRSAPGEDGWDLGPGAILKDALTFLQGCGADDVYPVLPSGHLCPPAHLHCLLGHDCPVSFAHMAWRS